MNSLQLTAHAQLEQEVCELENFAAGKGVEIEIDCDDDIIWIGRIERTTGVPGSGGHIIEKLIELAEEYDMPIGLACLEGYLPEYYGQFDFEIDHDRTTGNREDDMVVMVRSCSG